MVPYEENHQLLVAPTTGALGPGPGTSITERQKQIAPQKVAIQEGPRLQGAAQQKEIKA